MAARRNLAVLVALVAMLVAQPLLGRGNMAARMLYDGMFAAVLLAVVFVVFRQPWERRLAFLLMLPAAGIMLAYEFLPDRLHVALEVLYHACIVAFIGFAVGVILRGVFRKHAVRGDDVLGALSGYLLVGVAWGNLYQVTHLLVPGSFAVDTQIAWQLQEWGARSALFNYLSFATLTSLGYNDVTSVSPLADTLSWLEVMFGQFYMAVVVAQLVGMKLAQALAPDNPASKSP
jgi:hypothetical protein